MAIDQAGTANSNQKQASARISSEIEKQINPSIKFNPRQETREKAEQVERESHAAATPKSVEDAPTVDSTAAGL